MRIARLFAVLSALIVGLPSIGLAQDAAKAGLTIDYPGAIGILWHVSDSMAIRPDFAFSHSSSDGTLTDSDGWGGGFNVSVLFYGKKKDTVRTYFSPRFSYARTSSTTTLDASTLPPGGSPLPTSVTTTGNNVGGAGTFGAQYTPTRHFAVYGEVGIGFSHHKAKSSAPGAVTLKGSSWGTVAGVGIVIYP